MQDSQDTYNNFTISYTYNGSCIINGINTTDLTIQRNTGGDTILYQDTVTGLQKFSNYTLIVYGVNNAGKSLPLSSNINSEIQNKSRR